MAITVVMGIVDTDKQMVNSTIIMVVRTAEKAKKAKVVVIASSVGIADVI